MGRNLNYRATDQPGAAAPGSSGVPLAARQRPANSPAVPLTTTQFGDADQGGFRKLAFRAGLAMLFVRIAVVPELLVALLGVNTYLLYVVGPPAIFGAILCGGLRRAFQSRTAWLWLAFLIYMAISIPFSSWVGGSVANFRNYAEFSFPLLFTVGGLAISWSEVRATFTTIGGAGVLVIGAAHFLAKDSNGRVEMSGASMTIGNSNDLASHFILVLPFLLYIALDARRAAFIRYSMIVPMGYALVTILKTASRGALVAIVVSFLFILLRASAKQRMIALVMAITLAISIPVFLGGSALQRLSSMMGDDAEGSADVRAEARESQASRSYLLRQSLLYTMQHPVFGIGGAQFSNYEGKMAKYEGRIGNWHETHNAFTQVSSENGVPALIFFVLGIASAFGSVSRIHQQARRQKHTEIANASFCYLLSMVGFVVSIIFLANAYRFYLSAMLGLAIAICAVAKRELMTSQAPEPVGTGYWAGPVAPRPPQARPSF